MIRLMLQIRRGILAILCASASALVASSPKELRPDALRSRKGFDWKIGHSSHFDYFFEPASPAERDIEKIKATMEQAHAHVLEVLGEQNTEFRTQAFIVDSRLRMKQLCRRELNGWSLGTVLAVVYGDTIKAIGAHEECHLLSSHLWGHTREKWLDEGLAVYSDDNWRGYALHPLCKHLRANGKLIPLQSLMKNDWQRHYSDMATYPETGSFVKFLYERYGASPVKMTWQKGSQLIPQAFGKSINQLEQEWHSVIDATDASSVNYQVR